MELVGGSDVVATADSSLRDVRSPAEVDSPPRPRPSILRGRVPLSLAVLLVPLVVGLVRVLVSLHQPYIHYGDVAVIESAIRDTLGGHQLLGPYSHFGWFHPGPAYFYLVAPLYWVLHENARALFLGAFLINAGCAVAIVAVVRTRCGESAARWGTLVVGSLLFFTEASGISLYSPWNPALLGLPLLLVMVLVASSATGSTISLLWAVLSSCRPSWGPPLPRSLFWYWVLSCGDGPPGGGGPGNQQLAGRATVPPSRARACSSLSCGCLP
jgi:hypothetical protein